MNSVRGTIADGGAQLNFSVGSSSNQMVVGRPAENIVTVFGPGGATPPVPTSVVSRKTHGSAGTFDVSLPLTGTPGVECRSPGAGGTHRLVVTFANSVTVGGIIVSSANGQATGMQSASGAVVTVDLGSVANAQIVGVTLTNVNDGTNAGDVAIPFRVLEGDTSGNGMVTSTDIGQTKGFSGQPLTVGNFRADVNATGGINSTDLGIVKARSGTMLPP